MADEHVRIEAKLDKVLDRISSIDARHAGYAARLEDLMRRVASVEEAARDLVDDLEPIKKHVAMVSGVTKALGILSLLGGLFASVAAGIRQFRQ
jgi:hypothetical protein